MQLDIGSEAIITWGIAALLLLLALFTLLHVWRLHRRSRRFRRLIDRLSSQRLHDVVIEDGDGLDYFEHLVLLPGGIALIQVLDYGGVIFADEHIDLWTQVVGKKSFRFPNPLEQLKARLGVIRALTEEDRVFGWLLFSERAEFPKGRPAQLSVGRELAGHLDEKRQGSIDSRLREAWQILCDAVAEAPVGMLTRPRTEGTLSARAAVSVGLLFVSLAGLWLYWRLVP